MVGEESFILIDANTVSLLEIVSAVIIWSGVSETALVFPHAGLTGASSGVKVIKGLLSAACHTSLCFHGFASYGRL